MAIKKLARVKKKDYAVHHREGSLWAKGDMAGKDQDGYWEWFRKDGTRMHSGYFNRGKRIGDWITYDENGRVQKVMKME